MTEEAKRYRRIDRRKCLRLKSSLPVEISLYHRESQKMITEGIPGNISEISRAGVCIETDTVMVNGTHVFTSAMDDEFFLAMKISLPDGSSAMDVMGSVAWYNLAPETSHFRFVSGVIIVETEQTSKKEWFEFVSKIETSDSPL
ncbi:MAG: hypothetical protein JRE23_10580 [Deltaproteobacteria bacterium]|nr:hypothetical protein [Deltaproteobacteria bacterium]